ncbi:hypothetical protein BJ878DRAFT_429576 [Calycina marina]|uniref:Uncharacterized protein n=1 Tax=Calycina marina TaxID=1763456 RepID=A0A9P7YWN9_9HELO|nr:hypothetical protein BJ878DRAFT_429576 [Calycina marina]
MDEDSLPLPKLAWDASPDSSSHGRSRKRAKLTPPLPSSDLPLFSSDDDPNLENYIGGRRKKQSRGTWYDHQPAAESPLRSSDKIGNHVSDAKRAFKRQYDSGVFLGSDGTEVDEGLEEFQQSVYANLPLRQWNSSQNSSQNSIIVKRQDTPEAWAKREIERCLEEGIEVIDLSLRKLTVLSNDTIRPLSAFTRLPPVVEGVFERLEPQLKIFLAANSLTALPEELFNIESLTVLSLRGCHIYEIPPAIGKVRNLRELNLSQNRLHYLPYEILALFSIDSHLESFQIHPNYFYRPKYPPGELKEPQYNIGLGRMTRPGRGAIGALASDESARRLHPQWKALNKARTEVRYMDIDGSNLKGPNISTHMYRLDELCPGGIPVADADDVPTPPKGRGQAISRVPSLLEVALKACSKSPDLPRLHTMLPQPHAPSFPGLLETLVSKTESGATKCTICTRNFMIARTEWIEWWEISKVEVNPSLVSAASPLRQMENERDVVEKMVPLIRRGCSWACVPSKSEALPEEDAMEMRRGCDDVD